MKSNFTKPFQRLLYAFDDKNIRVSFIIIILIVLISTFLLSFNITGKTYGYNIGDISREDIRVPMDINYINETKTEMKKKVIAESVPIVFDRDASILYEKLNLVEILFSNISNTLEENPPIGTDDLTFQLISLKSRLPKFLHYKDKVLLELLGYKDIKYLKKIIFKILIHLYNNNQMGILDKAYGNPLKVSNKNIAIRIINNSSQGVKILRNLNDLTTIDEVRKRLYKICYSISPGLQKKSLRAVVNIVGGSLQPNLRFNSEESKRRIDEKVNSQEPVIDILKKGQTIVREGDTITTEILIKIAILNEHVESSNISYIFGILLLHFIFLVIFGYFILEFSNVFIPDMKSSFIIFSLILIFMLYTFFASKSEIIMNSKFLFALLLPIPFVIMIISILYNRYLAMLVGIFTVFFTSLISGGNISITILAVSSAVLGVFVNSGVEKRTDFLKGGFLLGLTNSIVVCAIALIEEYQPIDVVRNIGVSFASGLINSILALGIFPAYESLFGITTRFKLLELSDLNANIFKKMLVEASGTYHHSLIVSTMAETACNDINANYLLARVGAYYHDIGKIEDAGIYIENNITDSRAEILSPVDYSRLIIAHVEKGVYLAKKNNLPESIIEFIREHHGKSTMIYFYHLALETADKSKNDVEIEKEQFQYPGPKPQSKETAVVMLADSVESASRSLHDPDHLKLQGLVRKIIYNKLNEGELEDSDLSMSDLNSIQEAFLRILNGVYHTRIEYPDKDDIMELEKKVVNNHGTH